MACYNGLGLGHPLRVCPSRMEPASRRQGPNARRLAKARARILHPARARASPNGAKASGAKENVKSLHLMIGQRLQEGLGTSGASRPGFLNGQERHLWSLGCRPLQDHHGPAPPLHLHGLELLHRQCCWQEGSLLSLLRARAPREYTPRLRQSLLLRPQCRQRIAFKLSLPSPLSNTS